MEEDKRNKVDAWIIDKFRPFAKMWMEIARNALVVGVLIFLAQKSHSTTLTLLSSFTALVFGCYCLSYILLSSPPYRSIHKNRFIRWGLNLGYLIFIVVCMWMWGDIITKMIFQLAELQVK